MQIINAQLDSVFEALANKHRRDIIYLLSLQPVTISELAKQQKLSLPAIHKHIAILEKSHLLRRKKSGRCNFLALNRKGLESLRNWIYMYHSYWGSDEASLENYISKLQKE